jgi:hypothetical protein
MTNALKRRTLTNRIQHYLNFSSRPVVPRGGIEPSKKGQLVSVSPIRAGGYDERWRIGTDYGP